MADSLQKIDRLIEGQGKLVDLAINTKGELDEVKVTLDDVNVTLADVKTTGETTAHTVADLTKNTQEGFTDVRQDIADLRAGQELILQILREKLP